MYDQVDGVAMGSSLAPILANIFMGYHEKEWIRNYNYGGLYYYKRYVDDIFAVFETKDHALSFYNYINRQYRNIKFTMETEKNGKLPFLDVLVCNKPNLITSVYRKPTYTGLLTNFFSFAPSKYKNGLIKTLLDRCYKINNTWVGFDKDLENLTKTLNKNQFPTKLINKVTKKYLNLKLDKRPLENNTEVKTDTRFFKLPYIGKYSNIAQEKIQNLVKTFCKGIDVKVVLTPFKISSKFSCKDPCHFISNHSLFTNLFVQTVKFVMWVKPQGTSLPESMNTYRKTLSPTSLNICGNHVYVIVCAIRIVFQ